MLDFLFPKNEVSGTLADPVVLRCFLRWKWVRKTRVCSATGAVVTQASRHMDLALAGSPTAGFFTSFTFDKLLLPFKAKSKRLEVLSI